MLNSLYKYFVLHHHVGIPGVGSFSIQQQPALLNGSEIHAPAHAVVFVPGTALADKQFYQFLSQETGYSEIDAVRKFQDFAYQLRKDIQAHPQLTLKGFGKLKKNATGEISFESSVSVDDYFPLLPLTGPINNEIIHEDEAFEGQNEVEADPEEAIITKDRWWIWALILTVLALGIIGYFYMQGEIV